MGSNLSARDRRAADRRRRRGDGDEPDDTEMGPQLQEALKAAASAAAVGAAVGAARAYSSRRHDDERSEDDEPESHGEESAREAHLEPDREPEPHEEDSDEAPALPRAGRDDLREIVAEARRLLHDLHGAEAESVSSVSRGPDAWTVGLEVVEVRRIPDSTDVLATYEIELDGEGGVRRFERVRRYHRSEASRGGAS